MNPLAYYNEVDPFAASWIRELIADGLVCSGDVDERDIRDVRPADLDGYAQCHFFAGIAGWSLALRLAGWPDKRPVWTGSAPCQPFSEAGNGAGIADDRHLWPAFFGLIDACRPPVIFGEQVASSAVIGKRSKPRARRADAEPIDGAWLDLVFADLERAHYACGAVIIPACGVGAPHIRQRLWFVADAMQPGWPQRRPSAGDRSITGGCSFGELADANDEGQGGRRVSGQREGHSAGAGAACERSEGFCPSNFADRTMVDANGRDTKTEGLQRGREHGQQPQDRYVGPWEDIEWLPCRDGKSRPTQRRFQPVADGLWPSMVEGGAAYLEPLAKGQINRVGMLRGAGNAIVPQAGAEVIRAFMDCRS